MARNKLYILVGIIFLNVFCFGQTTERRSREHAPMAPGVTLKQKNDIDPKSDEYYLPKNNPNPPKINIEPSKTERRVEQTKVNCSFTTERKVIETDSIKPAQKNNGATPPQVMAAPPNDNCSGPTNLGTVSTTTSTTGTDVSATYDFASPSCWGGLDLGYNVFYTFTVPAGGGSYNVTVTSTIKMRPAVAIFQFATACSTTGAVVYGCNDYWNGSGLNLTVTASASCLAAGTYYIDVDCEFAPEPFTITVTQTSAGGPPTNDACASAVNLGTVSTTTTTAGNNTCASTAGTDPTPSCYFAGINNTVWYSFTTPATASNATVTVTHGTITYASVSAFSGSCGSFTQIGCADGVSSTTNPTMNLTCLLPSTTYYIMVWDDAGAAGTYNLSVTCAAGTGAPSNDLCANAINIPLTQGATLSNYSGSIAGTNVCANADQYTSGCFVSNNNNVWYKFVVPVAQSYYVDVVAGTIVDPMISVSSGGCGAFTEQGCGGDYAATYRPNGYYSGTYSYAGICSPAVTTTVYVMVDNSTSGSEGTFTVNVATLKDDDIAQPLIIDACGTTFNSTTIGATNCGNCGYNSNSVASSSTIYNNLDCNSTFDPANAGGSGQGTAYGGGTSGFYGDVPYSVENDSWYEFCVTQASTVTLTFSPTVATCKGPSSSLQMSIFKGSVSNLSYLNGTVHAGVSTATTYTFTLNTSDCAFVEVDGLAGTNCDYSLQASILPSCVLPVKLISFNGTNEQGRIRLDWVTTEESNAGKYVIERSDNGIDYKPLLSQKAKGNTNEPIKYTAYDEHPIMGGINYYRINEYDLNGAGGVLSQMFVSNVAGFPKFRVYPNPSNGKITLDMSNFSAPSMDVEICDIYGRVVWTSNFNFENGNSFKQIDLSMFEGGMYFVKATDGTSFYKQTLVISKGDK